MPTLILAGNLHACNFRSNRLVVNTDLKEFIAMVQTWPASSRHRPAGKIFIRALLCFLCCSLVAAAMLNDPPRAEAWDWVPTDKEIRQYRQS